MSAPERQHQTGALPGLQLARCPADLVELAAFRARSDEVAALATRRNWRLPAFGRTTHAAEQLAICVRPERWLLLSPPAAPGVNAAAWTTDSAEIAAVIDQSAGLVAMRLTGPAWREALARGCRLDLAPGVFPAGHAAATIIAQVSVILAALSSGVLLLTPATTARHFTDWLEHAAAPFGLATVPAVSVSGLWEDRPP